MTNTRTLTEERCPDCRFFRQRSCHRYPPTANAVKGDMRGGYAFPFVNDDDWCGEFRLRALSPQSFALPAAGADVSKALALLATLPVDEFDAAVERVVSELVPVGETEDAEHWRGMTRKLLMPLLTIHIDECRRRGEVPGRTSFMHFVQRGLGIPAASFDTQPLDSLLYLMSKHAVVTKQMLRGLVTIGRHDAARELLGLSPEILADAMTRVFMLVRYGK